MASVNRIILAGRVLSTPESRFSVEGAPISKFWMEINGGFNQTPGRIEVVCFQSLAEEVKQVVKDKIVLTEGRLRIRSYEDQSGSRKWVTEVLATKIVVLSALDKNNEVAASVPASSASIDTSGFEEIEPLPEEDLPF